MRSELTITGDEQDTSRAAIIDLIQYLDRLRRNTLLATMAAAMHESSVSSHIDDLGSLPVSACLNRPSNKNLKSGLGDVELHPLPPRATNVNLRGDLSTKHRHSLERDGSPRLGLFVTDVITRPVIPDTTDIDRQHGRGSTSCQASMQFSRLANIAQMYKLTP